MIKIILFNNKVFIVKFYVLKIVIKFCLPSCKPVIIV